MQKIAGIYRLISPSEKSYIGQSKDLETRLSKYRKMNGMHNQRKLLSAVKKYGIDSFKFEILEEIDISSLSKEESLLLLLQREAEWIEKFDSLENGYNCMSYGPEAVIDSMTLANRNESISKAKIAIFASEQGQVYREKLRQANLGKSPPNKGKPMSEEQKKKISEARRGQKMKPMTEERKASQSKAAKEREEKREGPHPNKGQQLTPEQRQKLCDSMKGKTKSPEWRAKIAESNRKTWKRKQAERISSSAQPASEIYETRTN